VQDCARGVGATDIADDKPGIFDFLGSNPIKVRNVPLSCMIYKLLDYLL